DGNGDCSVRACIDEANALGPGETITITIPGGVYSLTQGTLSLTTGNDVTINGKRRAHRGCAGAGPKGTTIQGDTTFGIFSVAAGVTLTLNDLSITLGHAAGGGAIDNLG